MAIFSRAGRQQLGLVVHFGFNSSLLDRSLLISYDFPLSPSHIVKAFSD